MGNRCICFKNVNYKDIKLDSLLLDQKIKVNEQSESTNLYTLAKYFNEGEKEINTKIQKIKLKRILSHQKAKKTKSFNNKGDSKYELMLKRLLDQKKIQRTGPKRRKTIRINNNIEVKKLIEGVVKENKEKMKINLDNTKRESILLNYLDKNKLVHGRQSFHINKFEHNKIKNNFQDTEINNGVLLNDIKNINTNTNSNYISDTNYACLPRKNSPRK